MNRIWFPWIMYNTSTICTISVHISQSFMTNKCFLGLQTGASDQIARCRPRLLVQASFLVTMDNRHHTAAAPLALQHWLLLWQWQIRGPGGGKFLWSRQEVVQAVREIGGVIWSQCWFRLLCKCWAGAMQEVDGLEGEKEGIPAAVAAAATAAVLPCISGKKSLFTDV